MLLTFLKNIFHDKLLQDDRQPTIIFDNPFGDNSSYGLLAPSGAIWIQLSVALLIQSLTCSLLAIPVYHLVVKKRGTMTSFLAGFGGIIPFALYVPFFLIKTFDIRNLAVVTGAMWGTSMAATFRCLEAMYGFSPPSVEISFGRYCLYFSLVTTELQYDPVTTHGVKTTIQSTLRKLKEFTVSFLLAGLLSSFLVQYSFFPFHSPIPIRGSNTTDAMENINSMIDHFHPGHIMNNLSVAALQSITFFYGTIAQIIGINMATGIETKPIAHQPLSKAISPSDFWSRRWNCFTAGLLKRGVFKPFRTHYSKVVAAIATFLVSGFIHEYVLSVFAFAKKEGESFSQTPNYGSQLSFFAWNGVVLIIESLFGNALIFQWMKHRLPQPIKTALILLTALPISHWFTHEYISIGLYQDLTLLLPLIVPL